MYCAFPFSLPGNILRLQNQWFRNTGKLTDTNTDRNKTDSWLIRAALSQSVRLWRKYDWISHYQNSSSLLKPWRLEGQHMRYFDASSLTVKQQHPKQNVLTDRETEVTTTSKWEKKALTRKKQIWVERKTFFPLPANINLSIAHCF